MKDFKQSNSYCDKFMCNINAIEMRLNVIFIFISTRLRIMLKNSLPKIEIDSKCVEMYNNV